MISLHVADTCAAFFVGLRTAEGRAIARLFAGRTETLERAAAVAAIIRLSECDDIHLASCITPGSVVVPVALALGSSRIDADFNAAIAAGYAAGLRFGQKIGGVQALTAGIWPSFYAAPLMAAVTASPLLGHDKAQTEHAIALAVAGTSGRAGRPSGTPSGRWWHFAQAVLAGVRAAQAAGQGFRGDISDSTFGAALESETPASINDVGFKPFPIARQGANAVLALQKLLANGLDRKTIQSVEVFVPAINLALLKRPSAEDDRLSRLCNMGFQLACTALAPEQLFDPERALRPDLSDFASRVSVSPAADLDSHLPLHWPARIIVHAGGGRLEETCIRSDYDAGREEILTPLLRRKWQTLLGPVEYRAVTNDPPQETESAWRAMLWQTIERTLAAAAHGG